MKRGFTLLELIVVMIIIGLLATLGVTQYSKMIEKSRAAEARTIIGGLRSKAAAIYMENNNSCLNCDNTNLGIGTGAPNPPTACASTHWFTYNATASASGVVLKATRCETAAGKAPAGTAGSLELTTSFSAGTDTWVVTGGY